jgi:hypothetical protein
MPSMKLTTFLIPALLSTLAASPAPAQTDFFGTKNGPAGLGAYPSAPEPVKPATPAPAKTGPLPPVAPVAPVTPLPLSLQALGPLQGHLKAWFSFNGRDQGGVAWSAEPLGASLSPAVVLRDVGGQRIADFGLEGAVLTFSPSATLGDRFTIAAWVAFPVRSKAASIFRGGKGDLLGVGATGLFGCAVGAQNHTFGTTPAPTSGWHHVALSSDGRQTTLFVDGRLQGKIAAVSADSLAAIGNHPSAYEQSRMMSASMDDVAIFNREMTDVEVVKLASVHAATTSSLSGESLASAGTTSSSSSTTTGSTTGTGTGTGASTILPGQPYKSALDAPAPTPKPEKVERDDDERYYPRRGGGGYGGGGGGRGRGGR